MHRNAFLNERRALCSALAPKKPYRNDNKISYFTSLLHFLPRYSIQCGNRVALLRRRCR